jgi:hypothetical protein
MSGTSQSVDIDPSGRLEMIILAVLAHPKVFRPLARGREGREEVVRGDRGKTSRPILAGPVEVNIG